ncbi:MaoC family dehydratase [Aliiroseovarius subalbicans]|uniref:MaoC family dehydratase n=1 Tax=Aliiroseovarius subalbicans TaxID=2925840 RepID=UPI0030840A51
MTPETLIDSIGDEIGLSRWFTLEQARIDAFADVTEDDQFIHTDPARAAQTPFGGPIAHGFLTLSMLSAMTYDALPPLAGEAMGVNYGFDRIRFVSPVPAGARIRARFTLVTARPVGDAAWELGIDVVVEIDGQVRPALVAHWLQRRLMTARDS